jgi:predicted nucleic acid-binding protein
VVHREAERLLFQIESVALRTLDALHVAAARLGSATYVVTFDARMRAAALHAGLKTLDL